MFKLPANGLSLKTHVQGLKCVQALPAKYSDPSSIQSLRQIIRSTVDIPSTEPAKLDTVIDELYLPLTQWILAQFALGKRNTKTSSTTVCIGLSIPQGGGKTTLTTCLEKALKQQFGINTVVVSYDDFYLTHEDQQKVKA